MVPAKILFDTGANKSFVSYELIRHPLFILYKLSNPLEVEVGDNKSFIVCDVYRDSELVIDGEKFPIDLVPMRMGEFKAVVGMD